LELNLPGSGARLSTPALPAEVGVRPLDIGVSSPTYRDRVVQRDGTRHSETWPRNSQGYIHSGVTEVYGNIEELHYCTNRRVVCRQDKIPVTLPSISNKAQIRNKDISATTHRGMKKEREPTVQQS
jgi:hypothetical protein